MSLKLITAKQTAEQLRISRPTLTRLKNEIGYYRVGSKTMFAEDAVASYLKRVEQVAAEKIGRNLVESGGERQC
jgi:excisionase family DNA binding protein